MTSRLDRLLLLLDTGSSTTVRHTAARQLAQLAAKSVAGDVANVDLEEDHAHSANTSTNVGTRLHVHASTSPTQRDPAAWKELMAVVAKILPFLHSRSHETRSAASTTLSHIFAFVPLWQPLSPMNLDMKEDDPSDLQIPDYPAFSLPSLLSPTSKLLLASSGKEFSKPVGILGSPAEVKRARKEAMSRLGLDFLDSFSEELDIDKDLADEDVDMETEAINTPPPPPSAPTMQLKIKTEDLPTPETVAEGATSSTAKTPSPVAPSPIEPEVDLSSLSARERNRLKRKRKAGNAFVAAPPQTGGGKYNSTAAGPKARLVAPEEKPPKSRMNSPTPPPPDEKVVIDPSKGGAIVPTAQSSFKALEVQEGMWVWDGLVKVLEVDLFSPAWQVRHGAAMALRELIKVQGAYGGMKDGVSEKLNQLAHEKWCNDLSAQFLCVLVLDRFGDFVSDQVVAPVRETVSQTLASLLIHMPKRSVLHVHRILMEMIQQEFPHPEVNLAAAPPKPTRGRGRPKKLSPQRDKSGLVWEVRHAGLLGIKYEVAVRNDLFECCETERELFSEDSSDTAEMQSGKVILRGVVDCAVQGLGDRDDDVRAVAAACLFPVAAHIVQQLPESLENILLVLYGCLCDMRDDLNSSVGAVMDLLGKLVAYDQVIALLALDTASLPLTTLAPSLFPFFRHTIANVRLAVVKTLHSFITVPSLPRSWITAPLLQLLFQNLIVEERTDVRRASLEAWNIALTTAVSCQGKSDDDEMNGASHRPLSCRPIDSLVSQELLLQWFSILMTPVGLAIDVSCFYQPTMNSVDDMDTKERHNVDKNMISQDQSLISADVTLKARLVSAIAIAKLMVSWPTSSIELIFGHFLNHYLDSSSWLQKVLAAVIVEEWALECCASKPPLIETHAFALTLTQKMLSWLRSEVPPAYHEMAFGLSRIHYDCTSLLQSFSIDCKLPMSAIPSLGTEIDVTGQSADQNVFTLDTAQRALGPMYTQLKNMLGKTKKKELAAINERRTKVQISIERYSDLKGQYDNRVAAALASAFVAFRPPVDKVGPIVKGIMNGVKFEESVDLQERFASAVASFVDLFSEGRATARDKIISNLCTFICSDATKTPIWVYSSNQLDGILSFRPAQSTNDRSTKDIKEFKDVEGLRLDDAEKASLSRRGSIMALDKLSTRFGAALFERVPNMWSAMTDGLVGTLQKGSLDEPDLAIKQHGQNVIDSLCVLEAVTPTLHASVWGKLSELFSPLTTALKSRYAIIRQLAAQAFSTICDVTPPSAMRYVVEVIVPLLGDPVSVTNREGATELMYHIVQKLDIKALPYVIFLVVPVLGRMSDPNDDIRATSTNTFASLVKMIPLEAGLPDPPDFPEELLKKRDTEREFLTQLLDGSKVQQYHLPVKINAELRPYQQDGVNWLAFLAKYQLHGILCDDMGLGKTLQSICILASKHYERSCKHKETKSPDSIHLPSLIVCPPTLSGHWYYEILKYSENLKPFMYVGSAKERARHIPKLQQYDVVITSYEIVRNDISNLDKLDWLYCILDEGHVIKNAKTKLTKAVKQLKAQHRLILSGTPIQNNVLELWSLFDFLMPGFLGTEHSFSERFSKPILANRDGRAKNGEAAALALEALHKQVLPFLLRRLKEDVLHDLPPKIIQDYYCDLSDIQKHLYDDFAKSRALASAEGSIQQGGQEGQESNGAKPSQHIFQALQYLRKLCNHPALVLKDDMEAIKTALEKVKAESDGLKDIQHAPKLLALKQLLHDCGIGLGTQTVETGKSEIIEPDNSGSSFSQHRVLIFCQMKQMLDIIEKDLFQRHMPSVTYMRLDGGTDATKRHNIVQTFNADPTIDCLLLTTHVGGLGLTLTGADTVIFVEHDWNPMKDLQAMDRAHRIGQKKVVNVYRLITKGTLEEKIMGLQRFKLNIANSVVTQQNAGLSSMDTDQVLDLFRRSSNEEASVVEVKRKGKDQNGPISQKNVLDGLEDLPPEDEYENLDLSTFMGSLGRGT